MTSRISLVVAGLLAALAVSPAPAQIEVETTYQRTRFLRDEALQVWVKVTNRFTRAVTLDNAEKKPWLVLEVTDEQGHQVASREKELRFRGFTVPAGQTFGRVLDLQALFDLSKTGRYQVQAVVLFEGKRYLSARQQVAIEEGRVVWERTIPLPDTASGTDAPYESKRQFELIRFESQDGVKMYVRISEPQRQKLYRCFSLGPSGSEAAPEAILENSGRLHVLQEAGQQVFIYSLLAADGTPTIGQDYSAQHSRPRLERDASGKVSVLGEKYVGPMPKMPTK